MATQQSEPVDADSRNTAESTSSSSSERSKPGFVIPAFLCFLFVAQCAWFMKTQSLSNDEPLHIVAGTEAWRLNRFERWNDHPPLVFLLSTLPELLVHGQISIGEDVKYADAIWPSPEVVARAGRPVIVLMGVLLGVLLWITARRLYFRGCGQFRAGLVRVLAVADRKLFDQLQRWRDRPDYFRCRDAARLLASHPIVGPRNRPWPPPGRNAFHEVQSSGHVRVGSGTCSDSQADGRRVES